MEEKKAYHSLSFFKVLLDSSASQTSIPLNFIRRFGERLMGDCKLEANEKWYNVKCEKIGNKFYFTQGWINFVDSNGLEIGYFLVFESIQETSSFSVMVFDLSQVSFPALAKRARVKYDMLEYSDKQHLPVSVPLSNKRARVKQEPSFTPGSSQAATETDSEDLLKPHVKPEIEDDDDDINMGREDFSDLTWSSLSFSATFKEDNWVSIPEDFAKKAGLANHKRVILKDYEGNRWPIDLKPMKDGRMKFTYGWEEFKLAFRVDSNVTCTFEFKGKCSNVLNVRVIRGRGRPRKQ